MLAGAVVLLVGCSDAPPAAKKAEPPPMPVTGRQAFQYVYGSARIWSSDAEPLSVRSINLNEVKSDKGKAGAWEVIFVSDAKGKAKSFSYSTIEGEGLHKGVFGAQEATWSASGNMPFAPGAVKIDTPEALETAFKASADYLKKPGTKPAINFMLENAPRAANPVWRVLWGNSVSSAEYSVMVDANTGEMIGKN
jgi:hypothetical protein